MPETGEVSLRSSIVQESWANSFNRLRKSNELCDITLVCDNGQVTAHKVILSAGSEFFLKIIQQNPHSHPLVYMLDTNLNFLQRLVDFMYSGEICIYQDHLADFLSLSSKLKILGLCADENVKQELTERKDHNNESLENAEKTEEPFAKIKSDENDENVIPSQHVTTELAFNESKTESPNRTSERVLVKHATISRKYFRRLDKDVSLDENSTIKQEEYTETTEFENCKYCNGIFFSKSSLQEHIETCPLNTPNEPDLKPEEDIKVVITNGENMNISKSKWRDDVQSFLNRTNVGYSCKECDYSSKKLHHAREHVEAHLKGYQYLCTVCKKIFFRFYRFRKHSC